MVDLIRDRFYSGYKYIQNKEISILQFAAREYFVVTFVGFVEIDDVPDGVEVIHLDILVLQVEGVFPDVNADDGDMRQKRVLIGSRGYRQCLAFGIDTEPTPSRPLNTSRGGVELSDQVFETSKRRLNGRFERTVLQSATMSPSFGRWGEVLPEKRVVDVPSTVEFDSSLKGNAFLCTSCLCVRLLCSVQSVDVGLMVFCMMKDHDFLRDVWLEGIVSVGKGRKLRKNSKVAEDLMRTKHEDIGMGDMPGVGDGNTGPI